MEATEPTPGPWRIHEDDDEFDGLYVVADQDARWGGEPPYTMARVGEPCFWNDERFMAVDEANARLIAAAPDLYAKLDKIMRWLDGLADQMEKEAKDTRFSSLADACKADARNYRATANDARKELAKAKGDSA